MSKKFNKEIGNIGERIAEKYLKNLGYIIVERNYKTDIGEIDIIANDGNYLVFVEVKAKNSLEFGFPSEEVDVRKQRKICMVAAQYIKRNMFFDSAVRFDVVEVYLNTREVNHIVNAFDSYLKY